MVIMAVVWTSLICVTGVEHMEVKAVVLIQATERCNDGPSGEGQCVHVEVANDQSGHTGYTAASTTTVLQEETETEIWMDTDQQTTTIKLQKMFF